MHLTPWALAEALETWAEFGDQASDPALTELELRIECGLIEHHHARRAINAALQVLHRREDLGHGDTDDRAMARERHRRAREHLYDMCHDALKEGD